MGIALSKKYDNKVLWLQYINLYQPRQFIMGINLFLSNPSELRPTDNNLVHPINLFVRHKKFQPSKTEQNHQLIENEKL